MTRTLRVMPALAALCLMLGLAATAQAADPNGTWTWSINRNGQDISFSLTLKADGEKLTGAMKLPMGDDVQIQNGSFKNDEISFETVFEFNGNSIKRKYTGKVEADTIKGKSEGERDGQVVSRDWEAKREKK